MRTCANGEAYELWRQTAGRTRPSADPPWPSPEALHDLRERVASSCMQAPPPTLWLRLRLRSASDQATGSMSAPPSQSMMALEEKLKKRLAKKLGREPTAEEVAAKMMKKMARRAAKAATLASPPATPMSTRQLVNRVIASRQSRSRVAPAQHARLPFRVKGSLLHEWHDDDLELRVMDTHGNLQPAESFLEFMRMVFVELVALNDALYANLRLECPDYDEWGEDDKAEHDFHMFRVCSPTSPSPVHLMLKPLGIPWPFMYLFEEIDGYFLHSLVARQRFESMWLRLVISKTKIAHLAFLFDDFCPKEDPFPQLKDLRAALGELANNFCESRCSCTIDEFTVGVSPSGARGTLATYSDGDEVRWITGRDQREIDEYLPSDAEMDY